ncbi:MAG: DUF2007 domain-containing protein [Pseudohongiellaceae bacterium]
MKIVYKANDILEAHIVAGMLQAESIEAHVGGHYLQGAVGDLAPVGLASVSVADEDTDAAMRLIRDYEEAGENGSFTA